MNLYEIIPFIDFLKIVGISILTLFLTNITFSMDLAFGKKIYQGNFTKEERVNYIQKILFTEFTPFVTIVLPRIFLGLFIFIYAVSYIWTIFPNILKELKNVFSF